MLPIIEIIIIGFLPILSDRPPSIGVENIPKRAYNADPNVIMVYATLYSFANSGIAGIIIVNPRISKNMVSSAIVLIFDIEISGKLKVKS